MPFQSRRLRRLAIASVLASIVVGAGASTAHADVQKTLNYSCNYWLKDRVYTKQPVQVDLTAKLPAFSKLNDAQPGWAFDANIRMNGRASEALDYLGAHSVTGEASYRTSLLFPSGYVLGNVRVPLDVARWERPTSADPLVLVATGATPQVTLDELGRTDIRLDKFALNLAPLDEAGAPIDTRKMTVDYELDPPRPADTDNNVNTFDVVCALEAGQETVLGSVCVNQTGLPDDSCGPIGPVDTTPPSKVVLGPLTSTVCPSRSVTVRWEPSIDGQSGITGYRLTPSKGPAVVATPAATSWTFFEDSIDGSSFSVSVVAVDDAGNASEPSSAQLSVAIADCGAGLSKPGPGVYDAEDIGETFLIVHWGASTAGSAGLKGYRIEYEGDNGSKSVSVPAGTTSYRFDGLGPDSDYYFYISAIDNAGNESEQSEEFLITRPRANQPPTQPTNVGTSTITPTSITLTWAQSTDDRGIAGYNVYKDTVKVNAALLSKPIIAVDGLQPDTAYRFTVEAVDTDGATARSADITARTAKPPITTPTLNFALKGSTSLKTLTTGNLPLSGGIKALVNLATGTFSADLTLSNTSGRLVAAGFLPLTAKVGFVPVGTTTGVLADSTATASQSISTNSKVRIKVLEVKLFGAIPLAGGNSCQTKSLSDINLKSTGAFDPLKGGTIGGTYAISDLNGCGPLNGFVSPLTAGKGNTISLALTRQP